MEFEKKKKKKKITKNWNRMDEHLKEAKTYRMMKYGGFQFECTNEHLDGSATHVPVFFAQGSPTRGEIQFPYEIVVWACCCVAHGGM
jgi:hypothetical protein